MMNARDIAVLIVNGENDPVQGRWLDLCLSRLEPSREVRPFHVYVWNNNREDQALRRSLEERHWASYLEAAPYETLAHPHAVPLQRLYALARREGAKIIVTLDSDAHPLRADWLQTLVTALEEGAALAGVWRDELQTVIDPYLHPSCLATTVDFVEEHRLRFDLLPTRKNGQQSDTMSHFTRAAQAAGRRVVPLKRSNANNFHRLMGGVYGDLIYHHGAGSRRKIRFWDDRPAPLLDVRNDRTRDAAAEWLFHDYDNYLAWLQGRGDGASFELKLQSLQESLPSETGGPDRSGAPPAGLVTTTARTIRPLVRKSLHRLSSIRRAAAAAGNRFTNRAKASGLPSRQMIRPIGPEDLHAVPPGWQVTGPAFIGVGAPKCGTTWWHSLLESHPEVVPNRGHFAGSKELQYFVHFQSRPLSGEQVTQYRQFFATPPGAICGEFSTRYLAHPNAIEQVARAAPDARILVMLRNPIDQMLSYLNHMRVNRASWFAGLGATHVELLHKYPIYCEAVLHCRHADALLRLFRHFERDKVLVLQYEQCRRDPARELARTYRFLGLDDTFQPADLHRKVNVVPYVCPGYTPEERAFLAAYFADDVARTAAICPELELGLWHDFAPPPEPGVTPAVSEGTAP